MMMGRALRRQKCEPNQNEYKGHSSNEEDTLDHIHGDALQHPESSSSRESRAVNHLC
jgi:hypothetical protein